MSFTNNKFIEVLGKIADMAIISILWLIACIPVITVIPATTALYYAVVKVIRSGAGYPVKDFLAGFIKNVKQGICVSIFYLFVSVLLYLAYSFSQAAGLTTPVGKFYYLFFMISVFLFACITAYFIPVLSRFEVSVISAFRMATAFSFGHLLTLIPLLLTFGSMIVVIYIFPPSIMVLPGAYCFLLSFSVEKVLQTYLKQNVEHTAEHDSMWYMDV